MAKVIDSCRISSQDGEHIVHIPVESEIIDCRLIHDCIHMGFCFDQTNQNILEYRTFWVVNSCTTYDYEFSPLVLEDGQDNELMWLCTITGKYEHYIYIFEKI